MEDLEDIPVDGDFVAFDDAKCGELQIPLVRTARAEEMKFVKSRNIYDYSTVNECHAKTGLRQSVLNW